MKKNLIFIIFIVLSCSHCHDSVTNPDAFIPESSKLMELIECQIIAKDTIQVQSTENAFLVDNYFSHIVYGQRDEFSTFTPVDTIVPAYNKLNNNYLMQFMFLIGVPKSTVIYDLEIRFHLNAFNYRSIVIPVKLYKYVFPSAEVYVNLNNLPGLMYAPDIAWIQGFDIDKNDLYFHLTGPQGLYRYTLGENKSDSIFSYPGGDWITLYENYLFVDVSHFIIARIDLQTMEIDFDFIKDEDWDIRGMDFKNDTLYVLHKARPDELSSYSLTTFDLNGNEISSEPFNYWHGGWSITIHEDDLYTWTFGEIVKYHIPTKAAEIIYPNLDISIESIQIIDGRFYYSDFDKRIICYLPLYDFLSY